MIVFLSIVAALLFLCLICLGYLLYWFRQGEAVIVQGNSYQLRARLYGKNKPKNVPAAIFFNGWSPGRTPWTPLHHIASNLARYSHMQCLVVALRGMGSQGDINALTRQDFLDDAIAAFDFLKGLGAGSSGGIYAFGESFGSYLACLLAARRPVAGLSLRVPSDFPGQGFADVPQVRLVGSLTHDWKSTAHLPADSPALQAVHEFRGPIQIISSERDQVVPPRTIQNYMEAVSDAKQLNSYEMKNLGHALMNPFKIREYYLLLSTWIDSAMHRS